MLDSFKILKASLHLIRHVCGVVDKRLTVSPHKPGVVSSITGREFDHGLLHSFG